jgi:CHAD domain-containing protein
MKEDAIIAQLELRIKKLKKHFIKLQKGFDPEELHDYRLEMKKLKAFIRLLNTNRPQQKKIRVKKNVKGYYALAGNVRNLQLHEQCIRVLAKKCQLETPVAYLALLEQERKSAMEQLKQAEKTVSFEKLHKEVLGHVPSSLSASNCKNYLVNQRNALAAILVPTATNDEVLHEVRKIVKDIGYNRDVLGSYMSLILPAFLFKKEQADALAEKLGVFHDYCVSLSFLQSPFAINNNKQQEKMILQEFQNIIEREKMTMKEEIIQQLSDS